MRVKIRREQGQICANFCTHLLACLALARIISSCSASSSLFCSLTRVTTADRSFVTSTLQAQGTPHRSPFRLKGGGVRDKTVVRDFSAETLSTSSPLFCVLFEKKEEKRKGSSSPSSVCVSDRVLCRAQMSCTQTTEPCVLVAAFV